MNESSRHYSIVLRDHRLSECGSVAGLVDFCKRAPTSSTSGFRARTSGRLGTRLTEVRRATQLPEGRANMYMVPPISQLSARPTRTAGNLLSSVASFVQATGITTSKTEQFGLLRLLRAPLCHSRDILWARWPTQKRLEPFPPDACSFGLSATKVSPVHKPNSYGLAAMIRKL